MIVSRLLRRLLRAALVASALLGGCVPDRDRDARVDAAFLGIVAAEDARPTGGRELERLVDGTDSETAFIRHAAVRALGRLERPELVEDIVPLLDDPEPLVRRSAANAVAQSFLTSEDASRAADILLERVPLEEDPAVRGTIARSLGRLALDGARRRDVAEVLVDMSRQGEADAPQETLVGVALGLEALIRGSPTAGAPERVARRLGELAAYPTRYVDDPDPARIRALAINALGVARRLGLGTMLGAIADREWRVGAAAARHLNALPPGQRDEVLRRVVVHPVLQTVLEGFRYLQSAPRSAANCRYLLAAAAPPAPGAPSVPTAVQIMALDGLAEPCPDVEAQRALLRAVAETANDDGSPWQAASHALVSLARLAPSDASAIVAAHVEHPDPFVRRYAARAAADLGDGGILRSLAEDPEPNVRTAAIDGLFALEGHGIGALLQAELGRADDPQLLITVADLLTDTPDPERAADAALDAFVRTSEAERETWRDARRALLRLIASVGDTELTGVLEPYLRDYDPVIADEVAELLSTWNGRAYAADPRPLPRAELPTVEDLRAMDVGAVRLHMADGGTIEIELHPYLATTNAYRFYRLVRDGYFDGLTFHRWAPNFVIQGGSPGANEYQGAAAYTRDEVGLASHWRGTVGISTRGRDTGDAQIFVNLLDNVRLDHTYTIIGTVTDGMQVVDAVLEGAVIERAEVVERDRVAGM